MITEFRVIELRTGEVVKVVKLQPSVSRNPNLVEKALSGLMRNMDLDRFSVEEIDDGKSISRHEGAIAHAETAAENGYDEDAEGHPRGDA